MNISHHDLDIISSGLVKSLEWFSESPLSEWLLYLRENEIYIDDAAAIKILEDYLSIDATRRCSPTFDYSEFIKDQCISLRSL
jgi:hypothetical protein